MRDAIERMLVPRPETENRTKPRGSDVASRRIVIAAFALAVHVLGLPAFGRENREEGQFVWNEARSIMGSARTEEDFLRAAEKYTELARMGARSGPLFYNLGTALLLAGRHEAAYAALARAERYQGTTFEIRRNMLLAVAGAQETDRPVLPWYRVPLFWHFRLPMSDRWTIALILFNLAWIALAFRKGALRHLAVPLLWISLVAFALFASSAATSLHAERKAEAVLLPAPSPSTVPQSGEGTG